MELKKKIKFFFIRKAARLFIHAILLTCRKEERGSAAVAGLRNEGKPVIYIFWHRHIFYNIFKFRRTQARPLISFSTDGEIVSEIAEEFGMKPIRGSSSKGGAAAFLSMINAIKKERSEILITADGPKGPLREIKDGTIHIARLTGAGVVPVSWHASRKKIFEKSWDRFMIPKPFSRIIYESGSPVFIPKDTEKTEYSNFRKLLKSRLDDLEEKIISQLKPGNSREEKNE